MPRELTGGRVARVVALLGALALGSFSEQGVTLRGAQQGGPLAPAGRTTTLLPDGRYLLVGGALGQAVEGTLAYWDPATNATVLAPVALSRPRAWHVATLLADGRVLIHGGLGADGTTIGSAEVFDPKTGGVQSLVESPFGARARHTATVLSDGRVLVLGGTSEDGRARDDGELWDPRAELTVPVPGFLSAPRASHTATTLADGAVRISGGASAGTRADDEVFDPELQTFVRWLPRGNVTASYVAASTPIDTAADVATDVTISVRFSRPVDVRSVNSTTVSLRTEDQGVPATLVPVEGGRLVFVRPLGALAEGTAYTVSVAGVLDLTGEPVAATEIRFSTVRAHDADQTPEDAEEWVPTGADRQNWRSGRPDSPWRRLPPLRAPRGVTALAGQILLLNGKPLTDVTMSIGDRRVRSDRTGRFLLSDLAPGRQVLRIDGRSASRGPRAYGIFHVAVFIRSAETNVLTYTVWMPALDTQHAVSIPSPTVGETVVTTPQIPGLELRLPPGTTIRDIEGRVVRSVSITAIPVDRPPFPLPVGTRVPIYFTIQPGGAYLQSGQTAWPAGARLIYPNYWDYRPGARVDFWQYDAETRGWFVYGKGTVTRDGRQIEPDAGVALYEFTGAMIADPETLPPEGKEPGDGDDDGDPVDLSTGQFILKHTDLYLPDVMPIRIERTYRPQDPASRAFGRGGFLSYDLLLAGDFDDYSYIILGLPDGGRVRFERTEPGISYAITFVHTATPSEFYGARLVWNDPVWDLHLKDGTTYVFPDSDELLNPYRAAVKSIRDRNGNTLTISRDPATGRITAITSPHGRWVRALYDASGRVTRWTDNSGRQVNYTYDAAGRLWKVTDVAGGVTEYGYDAADRMTTIKDPRGITYLTNEYDAESRVSRQTLADGGTYAFSYVVGAGGAIVQTDVTNPRGFVRRATFNADGYRTSDTQALGTPEQQTLTIERQPTTNLMLSTTDALGRRSEYSYDVTGNLLNATRLAGTSNAVTTTMTYGVYSQVTSVTDPMNHTVGLAYDPKGNLTSVTTATSQTSTRTYDESGRVISVTDPLGNVTQLSYVGANLSQVTDPLGHTTLFEYDSVGRLLRSTTPTGAATMYQYSPLNLVIRVVDALSGETAFTYDGNGNLLSLTDPKSQTTAYTYDVMDRVLTRTDPLGRAEAYTYDLGGNLLTLTDRLEQVTTWTYDGVNRPSTVTYDDASTTTYTYDLGNRLTAIVDSVAGTITRMWDGLDQLLEEETPQGTVTYTYDDAGRRATMTAGNQSATNYTYDDANRLLAVTRDTQVVGLSYDAGGRRTALSLPNGVVVTYSYDAASRLTGIDYQASSTVLGNLTYTYDANGNVAGTGGSWARTGLPSALTTATYDAANQLTNWGGVTITHDANGNMTGDGSRTLAWNARNQLAGLSGSVSASFVYDGLGRRQEKTIGSTTTGFLLDGLNPVQEQTSGGGTDLLSGLGLDEWFARTDAGGTLSFLTDRLGSAVGLVDDMGATGQEYTYQPFGAHGVQSDDTNVFTFTGRESDGTGLSHYRARYYHPTLQRFVREDPLEFLAGDSNLYAYVYNSPTNLIDPTGELPWWLVPMVRGCVSVAAPELVADVVVDVLSGRKTINISWKAAAIACATGAVGGSIIGPGGDRIWPKWIQRHTRPYIRHDPGHHGKPPGWDGKLTKWWNQFSFERWLDSWLR